MRRMHGLWHVAVIEPNTINADKITHAATTRPNGAVVALPKGAVDVGETPEQAAAREVVEETGLRANLITKLTDIKYFYVRSWGGRERVSKTVSFFLFRYHSGRIGLIEPDMRVEVRRAFWLPVSEAQRKLTYKGEREAMKIAISHLRGNGSLGISPFISKK